MGLGVLLKDTSTRPWWDRTGNSPTEPLLPCSHIVDNKVHPCAFFSLCLCPAERNYAIGDRELLALKLEKEERRHLLEGSALPFLVWIGHWNLEYVRKAKRLNPRQACWSLLFNHFNFTLLYRTSSHSPLKAVPPSWPRDAGRCHPLGRHGPGGERPESAIPADTPAGLLFMPAKVRPSVLEWAHSSPWGLAHHSPLESSLLVPELYRLYHRWSQIKV